MRCSHSAIHLLCICAAHVSSSIPWWHCAFINRRSKGKLNLSLRHTVESFCRLPYNLQHTPQFWCFQMTMFRLKCSWSSHDFGALVGMSLQSHPGSITCLDWLAQFGADTWDKPVEQTGCMYYRARVFYSGGAICIVTRLYSGNSLSRTQLLLSFCYLV